MSQDNGNTKRANPSRIDFRVLESGVAVTKFDRVQDRSIPWEQGCEIKRAWGRKELDDALAWCEENGYIVRRWAGGARAFKGELFSIRSASQINRMRDRLERAALAGKSDSGMFFDLRYDL